MNRIVIFLIMSVLVCAGAVGQSSRSLFHLYPYGEGERGRLGVSVRDVSKKLADKMKLKAASGAYVSDVEGESPAEEAGILEGDVIVKFGTKEIGDSDDLIRAVRKSEPGEEVTIVVNRGGDSKTLKATLDEIETPRAFSFTLPRAPGLPDVAPTHPGTFGMGFFRSGEHLGMEMQDLGKQLAEYFEVPGNRGVLVASVAKTGSAGKGGLKAGDVIVRVNKNTVRDVDDVLEEIRDAGAGVVPFEVLRRGKPLTLSVEIGEAEDDVSLYFDAGSRMHRDALRALQESVPRRHDMLHGLKERLMELKRDLKENARELKESLREELRSF